MDNILGAFYGVVVGARGGEVGDVGEGQVVWGLGEGGEGGVGAEFGGLLGVADGAANVIV